MQSDSPEAPRKPKSEWFALPPPSKDFIRFKRGVGRFLFVLCICAAVVMDNSFVESNASHSLLLGVIVLPDIFCGILAASIVAPFFLSGVTVPWSGTAFCSGIFVGLSFSLFNNTWIAAVIADVFLCGVVGWICHRRLKLHAPVVVQGDARKGNNIITG